MHNFASSALDYVMLTSQQHSNVRTQGWRSWEEFLYSATKCTRGEGQEESEDRLPKDGKWKKSGSKPVTHECPAPRYRLPPAVPGPLELGEINILR